MRLPKSRRRKAVESALSDLRDMWVDYEASIAGWPEKRNIDLPSYKKGKRDAYRLAVAVLERALS